LLRFSKVSSAVRGSGCRVAVADGGIGLKGEQQWEEVWEEVSAEAPAVAGLADVAAWVVQRREAREDSVFVPVVVKRLLTRPGNPAIK